MQTKQPALVLSVAAPEDATWLTQWEKHLLPLQQTGHLSLWSERLLLAGENRAQQMNRQIDQANLIVFLLSPDFFASEECLTLMERALMRQHNELVTLVPLLLRPSTWQDSPLGSLSCLPQQAQPVTSWSDRDEALQTCIASIRKLLGLPLKEVVKKHQISFSPTRRLQVIHALQQEYRQRRDHSLRGQVPIALGLHERNDVIASSARLVFHDTEASHSLPTGTAVIQVYDRAQFGLLILGAPGAGKTTLLLDLALELLERAENNTEHPLPIILSLSSWGTKKLSLNKWLPEQLFLVYGIAKKVGASWSEQDQILFLLDGLDEMEVSVRSACITALNHYRAEHFVPLVVASRRQEYEQQQERLILPTAVEIQPLKLSEVMNYLIQAGPTLAKVHTMIQTNTVLQQLLTTPLMLTIVLLTYQDTRGKGLPQVGSAQRQQRQIFEQYVQQMLERYQNRRTFSTQQISHMLLWLAQQMQQRHLTEFYLERLQPSWLPTKRSQILYHALSSMVVGLVIGPNVGIAFWLLFGSVVGPLAGLVVGLIVGLGLELRTIHQEIRPKEIFTWSSKNFWRGLVVGLLSGGLVAGLFAGLVVKPGTGLGTGLVSGLLVGPLLGLLLGLSNEQINEIARIKPNQGIRNSGWNALRIGLMVSLVVGLIFWLGTGLLMLGLDTGLPLGLLLGLSFGGNEYLRHYLLRFSLAQNHSFPWRAVPLLDEATDCILLQRVGGGYRFIHPLLQEHFASLDVETVQEQETTPSKSLATEYPNGHLL